MLLHANHAALRGHKILIRTVDTDVVVLAVSVAETLGPEYELWLAFGTGKHFRHLVAHKIAIGLGPKKAQALSMFHTLTGCDTGPALLGMTAWRTWNAQPQLTDAMLTLSCASSDIQEDVMHTIEKFVILLYDRTSTRTDIDKAR